MYQNNSGFGGGSSRPLYDVSALGLTCAFVDESGVKCTEAITQLPFQPRADKPVFCKKHRPRPPMNRGDRMGGFRN
jgi:hypothetical protein